MNMKKIITPFISLEREIRPFVTTDVAAYFLNRKPQTLRGWACLKNGPIKPIRINGRLGWSTSDIRKLLKIE